MKAEEHAHVRIHPPILLAAALATALGLHRLVPLAAVGGIYKWLGVGVVLAGMVPALLAVLQFIRTRTTLDPHGSVRVLVTEGPYRYSRNPIYVGYICAQIGLPLALGSLWGLVSAPALWLGVQQLVIRPEEEYLLRRFPEEYTKYRQRVPRWL